MFGLVASDGGLGVVPGHVPHTDALVKHAPSAFQSSQMDKPISAQLCHSMQSAPTRLVLLGILGLPLPGGGVSSGATLKRSDVVRGVKRPDAKAIEAQSWWRHRVGQLTLLTWLHLSLMR